MQNRLGNGLCLFIASLLTVLSCTVPVQTDPGPAVQKQQLKQLILEVRQNPRSHTAYRNLGSALFELKMYKFAVKSLLKAYRLNTRDAQTLYYLAQLLEMRDQTDRALQIYGRYTLVKTPVEYKHKMQAQYQLLGRGKMRGEIQRMMQSEALLEIKSTSPKAVAVMPLKYMGSDDQYAPIGKGVAEMIMTDLSQVRQLDVVERIRVQALLDEMNLSQTGLMDVTSTPRMGKLLGAGKMIQGNFVVEFDRNVLMDVTYADILARSDSKPVTLKDNMEKIFELEKNLVFQVIGQMGIELTHEEKQRIEHVPTRNLQAFMAYCMGLEMEDRGNYEEASRYYQQASQMDPGYQEARDKSAVTQDMAQISTQSSVLYSRRSDTRTTRRAVEPESPLARSMISRETMIMNRLQTTNRNIGSTFIPGQDSRKSTQEFITAELLSETLGESMLNLTDIDVESILRTITLPDLPRPPEPPTIP
ncbi:hypothetical protein JW948_14855 [bacterium]|nr:hypothetical protein [bacterium]